MWRVRKDVQSLYPGQSTVEREVSHRREPAESLNQPPPRETAGWVLTRAALTIQMTVRVVVSAKLLDIFSRLALALAMSQHSE